MVSNREIERLFDKYNPNKIKSGDRVVVTLGYKYTARVVGLDLDVKNHKVYANLKLSDPAKRHPIRVDVADCKVITAPIYIGHHHNG